MKEPVEQKLVKLLISANEPMPSDSSSESDSDDESGNRTSAQKKKSPAPKKAMPAGGRSEEEWLALLRSGALEVSPGHLTVRD